jgi:hypothetical protein
MGTIGNIARAIAEFFSFMRQRTDLKNKDDVRDRAKANAEGAAVAITTKAVATNNTKELRDELAE